MFVPWNGSIPAMLFRWTRLWSYTLFAELSDVIPHAALSCVLSEIRYAGLRTRSALEIVF